MTHRNESASSASPAPAAIAALPLGGKVHTAGTLRYTAFGLIMVMVSLLWGDFVWTMLDQNLPGILPFKLKDMGASDWTIQILLKTVPAAVVFMFAPVVAFKSDRYRSRWGRRIPFLAWSTPLVGLFLILMGCYESVTNVLLGGAESAKILGLTMGRSELYIAILGAMIIGFTIVNIFVNSVYWYLFNDVVPKEYMTRFMAMFQIVGRAAGIIYSKWVFPNVLQNFRFVFVVAGVLFTLGFLVMCFTVKEGRYPPPPENAGNRKGVIAAIKTYCRECFTHRFYWYLFLANTLFFMSYMSTTFSGLRNRDSLHLNLHQLGDLGFWGGIASLIIMYPAGWLADKFNPVRVWVWLSAVLLLAVLSQCIFVFTDFGPHGNLIAIYITSLAFLPINAVLGVAELSVSMILLPRDRYGQFASAGAMIRSFATIFGSILAVAFMNSLAWMGDWHYRFYAVWQAGFHILALVFMFLLYREWKRRGGADGYTPPGV